MKDIGLIAAISALIFLLMGGVWIANGLWTAFRCMHSVSFCV